MANTAHNITTTAGETFTNGDSAELARMVLKRFGNDLAAAASAWRRMLGNNCSDAQFAELVDYTEPPKAPELVVAALAGEALPKVGDGATEYLWSDRHAYTVVEVVSPTCVKVQRDNFKRTDKNGLSESQSYEFTPNPEAKIEVLVFKVTKRFPEGVWVRKSDGVRGNKFGIGRDHREEYRDPSF